MILRKLLRIFLVVCLWPTVAAAQTPTVTVTHNVNLRPDSSTEKSSIRLLKPPTQLELLAPDAEDGFLNVRTAERQEG